MALEKLVMGGYIKGSMGWDPGSLGPGAITYVDMYVPGAAPHDFVIWEADDIDWYYTSWAYALDVVAFIVTADWVRIRITNTSTAVTSDLPSTTWRVLVIKS